MRPLTAETWYAQNQRGAAYRVTAEVKARSTFAGDPFRLVSRFTGLWAADGYPYRVAGQPCDLTAAACAAQANRTILHVLRSDAAASVGVRRVALSGTTLPATAPVTVAALAAPYAAGQRGSTPGIGRVGSQVRLVYADGDRVYWLRSLDDGVTWSAPALLYDGTGSYVRYSNFALRGDDVGRWVLLYSAWTPAGQVRIRGAHDVGAGWVHWPVCPTTVEWQVAGVPGASALPLNTGCAVYLYGRNYTWSTLAVGRVTLANGVFVDWWDALEIVDRAGLEGETSYDRVRTGEAYGAYWLTMQEGPEKARRYWVRASLWGLPGSSELEEPVLLSDEDADASLSPYEHLHLVPVAGTKYVLALGAAVSALLENSASNAISTLDVIAYRYEQSLGRGGTLTLQVRPGGIVVRPGFPLQGGLPVHPGCVLELTRTVTALDGGAAVGGSDRRIFRVASVTHKPQHAEIVAYDGPGLLWQHVLRRAKVLRSGDRSRADDLKALIVWAGVKPDRIDPPDPETPSPGFVAAAGSSLGAALAGYLEGVAAWVRPGRIEGGGIAYDHPSVSIVPGTWFAWGEEPALHLLRRDEPADVYAELAHYLDGETLAEAADDSVLVVAIGMRSSSPADGEEWRVQIADPYAYGRVRPQPVVRRNRTWTAPELEAVVAAAAGRTETGPPRLWVRCPVHLGVELGDRIAYRNDDQALLRVVELAETLAEGRIDQVIGIR